MAPSGHTLPRLRMVFCDREGQIYDHPEWAMAGASGGAWRRVRWRETIPLPTGSSIVAMPDRFAVGWDPSTHAFQQADELPDIGPACAAAVLVEHLTHARDAIASFGQGCEGEPLLRAGLIAASLGTSMSKPVKPEAGCEAG